MSRVFDISTVDSDSIVATSAGARSELGELGIEAAGKAVERLFDESVRRSFRNIAARARRDHVQGNGMVRLHFEPILENGDRFVDFTEGVVSQREQPASFWVLRPERDDFAEANGCFARPLLAVEQDAEVGVPSECSGLTRIAAR